MPALEELLQAYRDGVERKIAACKRPDWSIVEAEIEWSDALGRAWCHKATTKDGSLDAASFKTKHDSCLNCHKDPHRGEINTSCAICHSAHNWRKNLTFYHSRDTDYRLEGKHRSVKCVKCHTTGKKDGLLDVTSFRVDKYGLCAPCHKHKHKGTFIVACDTCHGYDSWKRKIVSSPY